MAHFTKTSQTFGYKLHAEALKLIRELPRVDLYIFIISVMRQFILLVLTGLLFVVSGRGQNTTTNLSLASKPWRTDQILVQPKPGTGLAALERLHASHGSRRLRTFEHLHNLQVIQVPAGETVESLVAKYRQSGLVEYAEPDYTGNVFDTIPNEAAFANGTLWGLTNISAPAGWDVTTSASNIVVAVVDTGVRYTHQDLSLNMWTNPVDGSHGWNTFGNNNNPMDQGTHGTMVAGVLGAVGSNGVGVVGVAWRVQIMACSCFNNFGVGNVSDVITCLEFARTNGARIVNASWGFPNSLALSNAMVNLLNAGIIVVAACGNNTSNVDLTPTFPACYPFDNIITVASTSKSNTLSSFSNYGLTNVDLAAPGEQIYTTFPATDSFYFSDSGTSFSAPYVVGACALLMREFPADSYQNIIARILNSTDPLPTLAGKCVTGGRLSLQKALRSIRLASIPFTNNAPFQLMVSGGLNRTCVVSASALTTPWVPIFTNATSTNGTFIFADSEVTNVAARFFRASASP